MNDNMNGALPPEPSVTPLPEPDITPTVESPAPPPEPSFAPPPEPLWVPPPPAALPYDPYAAPPPQPMPAQAPPPMLDPSPPVFAPPPVWAPPPYRPHTKGKSIARALLPLGVFIGAQLVIGLPIAFFYFIRYAVAGGNIEMLDIGPILPPMLFFPGLAGTIALWLLYRREAKERWVLPKYYPPGYPKVRITPFPLTPKREKNLAALFFVTGVATLAANLLLLAILHLLHNNFPMPPSPLAEMMESIPQDLFSTLFLFLSITVLAPLGEELCFRGLIQNHLRRTFPFWAVNLMQAGLFGAIHMNFEQGSYAFLAGLAFGWLYEKTGRLSLAIYLHFVFNTAGFFIVTVPVSPDNAPVVFILLLPALIVLAAGMAGTVLLLRDKVTAGNKGALGDVENTLGPTE